MTVPGRVEAASLLLSLDPPDWFVRHARAVAEVAAWLAVRIETRGVAVDRRLVEAAALLHDADKSLPAGDLARALPHGEGSAGWLTRRGHPELARSVAGHPVTRLLDGKGYRRWVNIWPHVSGWNTASLTNRIRFNKSYRSFGIVIY